MIDSIFVNGYELINVYRFGGTVTARLEKQDGDIEFVQNVNTNTSLVKTSEQKPKDH